MKYIAFLALLALGGCETLSAGVDTAKSFVYAKGAKLGNDYCEVKDPAFASDIEGRLNTGLRAEGAKFAVSGAITCDP